MKMLQFPGVMFSVVMTLSLAGCSTLSKPTQEALDRAKALADQKNYQQADDLLTEALQSRTELIESKLPPPDPSADPTKEDSRLQAVRSDTEILLMERAQVGYCLQNHNFMKAATIYADIKQGNPTDTVVFDLARDPDPAVRQSAVRVLGTEIHPDALPSLLAALKDQDKDVREVAATSLGSLKKTEALPALVAALRDQSWVVRSNAADALCRLRDVQAIEPLLGLMKDEDASVRNTASTSLLILVHEPGVKVDALVPHFTDPDERVRTLAATCAALLKDKRATPILIPIASSSHDMNMRYYATSALGESNDPQAVPVLRQGLKAEDPTIRGLSIIGLGKLKDADSIAALKEISQNEKETPIIRSAAQTSLEQISPADATVTPSPDLLKP